MKKSSLPRVALVGYGYWGPNLLRNLVHHGGFEVAGIVDARDEARAKCARTYPHLKTFATVEALLEKEKLDAVLIATPPPTHRPIAIQCMEAGADVLIEKPMALSVADCDAILDRAKALGRRVMVDHTFVYNPAVDYLASQVRAGALGDLLYFDSVRVNLDGYQTGADVLWDLAPHDFSILDHLLGGKQPREVSVTGAHHFGQQRVNLAYCHLRYENEFVAHLHLNWVAPVKVRTIMLGGTKRMAVYDENTPTEKIKLYDKGLIVDAKLAAADLRASYRVGDMVAPALSTQEPLANMLSAFHRYLTRDERPVSDGHLGRRVVEVLEAASRSLAQGGGYVPLAPERSARKAA